MNKLLINNNKKKNYLYKNLINKCYYSYHNSLPKSVSICEVGPRDGLQNEILFVDTDVKIELINKLSNTGLKKIECTSFVSKVWVPQMGDNSIVMEKIERNENCIYTCLTPNMKGYELAIKANADEVAIFAAASEKFSKYNINCTIQESLDRFIPIMEHANKNNINVRGYVSCVVGCPYQGEMDPKQVADVSKALIDMGCYEISLGDTIGVGTPGSVSKMLKEVLKVVDVNKVAFHAHNTYGQALANIYASLQEGISVFDSSVAGLGGCPYAVGASGNVSTEDVVYMFNGLDIETGIDIDKVVDTGDFISRYIGKPNSSFSAKAILAKRGDSED